MKTSQITRPGKRWFSRTTIIPARSVTGLICYYWFNTKAERDQHVAKAPTKRRAVVWAEVARTCGINFASVTIPEEEVAALGEPLPMGKVIDQRRRPRTL